MGFPAFPASRNHNWKLGRTDTMGFSSVSSSSCKKTWENGNNKMRIIVDTREQCHFTFATAGYDGIKLETGTLDTGDYSLTGLETCVAVERKSLADLVACFDCECERFERELHRSAALDAFSIAVEAPWSDLAEHKYKSKLNPHSACQSVLAFTARYRVPFLVSVCRITQRR